MKKKYDRVTVYFTPKENNFLTKLTSRIYRNFHDVTKSMVVRSLVNAFAEKDISLDNVKSEVEMTNRIISNS